MGKQKKLKKSDAETLKHYESYDAQPREDLSLKKIKTTTVDRHKSSSSTPKFIKPEIAVDHVMSNRKSALIKDPSKRKDK